MENRILDELSEQTTVEREVIIDARNLVGPEYGRIGTLRPVVKHALDMIEVGKHVHVEAMRDAIGQTVPWERLHGYVSTLRGDRRFTIRKCAHGDGYEIHRIA